MRRLVIAGSWSHCGKTTITCGLLEAFRAQGLRVSACKTGPDYIDPKFLSRAADCDAHNLDTWLMTEERVLELFTRTSRGRDITIIEGAMGLYDGGSHSTASIAKLLRAPVILVVDAKSLGESAAAAALGFREYDSDVDLAGVILNNAGSDYHVKIIADELAGLGMNFLGALRRNDSLAVPERPLGLDETVCYDSEPLISSVREGLNLPELLRISERAPELHVELHSLRPSAGVRIGVARDEAFTFYYPESLKVLEELGAELVSFSPLHDPRLPEADGYIFGGGRLEVFAETLSGNSSMLGSVRENKRPVLAESGGMIYLCRRLTDLEGRVHETAGVIPRDAVMTRRPVLGYMTAKSLKSNILCEEGVSIRGHEFHYSRIEPEIPRELCAFELTRRSTGDVHFGGWAQGNILASYLHVNFFGYPEHAQRFINSCVDINSTSTV